MPSPRVSCSRAGARPAWRYCEITYLETLRAEREVIVCARAYHSPHLLLLSGLGPADELRALGIEPAAEQSVGRNLLFGQGAEGEFSKFAVTTTYE